MKEEMTAQTLKAKMKLILIYLLLLLFEGNASNNDFYSGCETERLVSKKFCFGIKETSGDDCVTTKDCDLVTSVRKEGQELHVEILRKLNSGKNMEMWMAFGLSEDTHMGSDIVSECLTNINGQNNPGIRESWNIGNKCKDFFQCNKALAYSKSKPIAISQTPNFFCSFRRTLAVKEGGIDFDVRKRPFHVLLASGVLAREEIRNPNGKAYHGVMRKASPQVRLPGYEFDEEYKLCDKETICFGIKYTYSKPNFDCVKHGSCKILIRVVKDWDESRTKFAMTGFDMLQTQWIGVGLSLDDKMGEDLVYECSPKTGVQQTWNVVDGQHRDNIPIENNSNSMFKQSFSYVGEKLQCIWFTDKISAVTVKGKHKTIDLSDKYFLLLAYGFIQQSMKKDKHDPDARASSLVAYSLPHFKGKAGEGQTKGTSKTMLIVICLFVITMMFAVLVVVGLIAFRRIASRRRADDSMGTFGTSSTSGSSESSGSESLPIGVHEWQSKEDIDEKAKKSSDHLAPDKPVQSKKPLPQPQPQPRSKAAKPLIPAMAANDPSVYANVMNKAKTKTKNDPRLTRFKP